VKEALGLRIVSWKAMDGWRTLLGGFFAVLL